MWHTEQPGSNISRNRAEGEKDGLDDTAVRGPVLTDQCLLPANNKVAW